jgi:hypothetical protein
VNQKERKKEREIMLLIVAATFGWQPFCNASWQRKHSARTNVCEVGQQETAKAKTIPVKQNYVPMMMNKK